MGEVAKGCEDGELSSITKAQKEGSDEPATLNLFEKLPREQAFQIRSCKHVTQAALFAARIMKNNEASHDFQHVLRVHKMALEIGNALVNDGVQVDLRMVQIASLLHDVYDRKVYKPGPGDPSGSELLLNFVLSLGLPAEYAEKVVSIADGISFSKQAKNPIADDERCVEMDIVQDADRLEAIGAIGIVRCFDYGGHAGRPFEYSRAHFDHKILKLSGLMRTPVGAKKAKSRHEFVVKFLRQLDEEMS